MQASHSRDPTSLCCKSTAANAFLCLSTLQIAQRYESNFHHRARSAPIAHLTQYSSCLRFSARTAFSACVSKCDCGRRLLHLLHVSSVRVSRLIALHSEHLASLNSRVRRHPINSCLWNVVTGFVSPQNMQSVACLRHSGHVQRGNFASVYFSPCLGRGVFLHP